MTLEPRSGLAVVGSYTYPYEADLAKALLDSHGIEAFVLDEFQIRMRWHLSQALGGVKVAVRPDDEARAHELLSTDYSAEVESIPEAALPGSPDELCRYCGSQNVTFSRELSRVSTRTLVGGFLTWFFGPIFPFRMMREDWRCLDCRKNWMRERRA